MELIENQTADEEKASKYPIRRGRLPKKLVEERKKDEIKVPKSKFVKIEERIEIAK